MPISKADVIAQDEAAREAHLPHAFQIIDHTLRKKWQAGSPIVIDVDRLRYGRESLSPVVLRQICEIYEHLGWTVTINDDQRNGTDLIFS